MELSTCGLFTSMSEKEIMEILSEIHIRESVFHKGDVLALQDEPCNRLIYLLSGSVKAEMSDPSGKVVKVEDIHAPNPLAILFLFGPDNHFPVQATANESIMALVIPKESVLKMLSLNRTILKNYLDISATFAGRLSRKLHFMSFRTIRQKLALYLLELSNRTNSHSVTLDLTKTALAEYFGVSRPALERELSRMQDDGLLESRRHIIILKNKNKLMKLVRF